MITLTAWQLGLLILASLLFGGGFALLGVYWSLSRFESKLNDLGRGMKP